MTGSVTLMSGYREPVTYSVHVVHHWDGRVEVEVEGISSDMRSRKVAAEALLTAAELLESKGAQRAE